MGLLMGIALMITGVAPAIGPTLGGTMIMHVGWRAIFWFLMPFLIFSLCAGSYAIRQSLPLSKPSFDLLGYFFLALSFICLIVWASLSSQGWTSPRVLLLMLGFIVFLMLFVMHSLHHDNPIIHPQIFAVSPFTTSLITYVSTNFMTLGLGFLIPNFLQLTLHKSTLTAGVIMMPGAVVALLFVPLSGKIYDQRGVQGNALAAVIFMMLAQLLFSFNVSHAILISCLIIYMIYALGQGFSMGTYMTHALAQIPEKESADGNAIFNTLLQLFGAIGTSIVSSVVAASQKGGITASNTAIGTAHGYLLLVALSVAAFICALITIHDDHAVKALQSSNNVK